MRRNAEITKDIHRIIRAACQIPYGDNFKKKVPLHELINYKIDDLRYFKGDRDTLKFKTFVGACEKIINGVKEKYPFIDLTGIDVRWTTDEIVDMFHWMYANVPPFKIPEDKLKPFEESTEEENNG
jgi:hypothetical protein